MTRTIIFILIGVGLIILAYKLFYKPSGSVAPSGTLPVTPPATRMTSVQAQNIIDGYATKDAGGLPTITFNGTFDKPNLSKYPQLQLQKMLNNGWWLGLLTGGNLNGYQSGSNGNYLVSIIDSRNTKNSINAGKSQITIPVNLQPYLNL